MDIPLGEKTYYGQCNQICGTNHAYMPVVVKVLSKDKYKQWLEKAKIEFASNDSLSGKEMILADMSK